MGLLHLALEGVEAPIGDRKFIRSLGQLDLNKPSTSYQTNRTKDLRNEMYFLIVSARTNADCLVELPIPPKTRPL